MPELRLHLATEITPLWQATEDMLRANGLPPPYWAFCWPGSQVLARHVLDHPEVVAGRDVVDFAAGGGVAAIAAAKAGAARVRAVEVDAFAAAAIRLNAALNDVTLEVVEEDVLGRSLATEVVLAGDVCYERPMAERVLPWLRRLARDGALVLLADPGRAYAPTDGITALAVHDVPTTRELEDSERRRTTLYRIEG